MFHSTHVGSFPDGNMLMTPQGGGSNGQDNALDIGYRKSLPQQGHSTEILLGGVTGEVTLHAQARPLIGLSKMSSGKL